MSKKRSEFNWLFAIIPCSAIAGWLLGSAVASRMINKIDGGDAAVIERIKDLETRVSELEEK